MAADENIKKEGERKSPDKKKNQNQQAKNRNYGAKKFEGEVEGMKGNIFDCGEGKHAELFVRTQEYLAAYVGESMKNGGDMRSLVLNLAEPTFQPPVAPADSSDVVTNKVFEKLSEEYAKRQIQLIHNNGQLYSIVWRQCTDALKGRLMRSPAFKQASMDNDGLNLLKLIQSINFQVNEMKDGWHSVDETLYRIYRTRMGHDPIKYTLSRHYETLTGLRSVLEQQGGQIAIPTGLYEEVNNTVAVADQYAKQQSPKMTKDEAIEKVWAYRFLLSTDRARYGELLISLENDFQKGRDYYPRTIDAAYQMCLNYRRIEAPRNPYMGDGVNFNQVGTKDSDEDDSDDDDHGTTHNNVGRRRRGKQRRNRAEVTCFNCGEKGHYANECTKPKKSTDKDDDKEGDDKGRNSADATTLLNNAVANGEFDDDNSYGFYFHQQHNSVCLQNKVNDPNVSHTWILLDNQSTIDVFSNSDLLTNIREGVGRMNIHCNAGVKVVNQIGELAGYGTVWYNPDGIANILSMSRVIEKGHKVQYDSENGNQFVVTKSDGTKRVFRASDTGLYYFDAAPEAHAFITTVAQNKDKYTNRDYNRALLARKIQQRIGRPGTRYYINLVDNNLIPNIPITRKDIIAAEDIFGPDVGSLKGKTVRRSPISVESYDVNIPPSIMETYRNVTLAADIMFINKICFFMTISRNIKFYTAEMITNQKMPTILHAIKQLKAIYMKRGFNITTILMDGQFEPLRTDLAGLNISLNSVSRDEHVPEIERAIRTVKERVRSVYNVLPFPRLPRRLLTELVYYAVFWLNSFPAADGISSTISPRSLITGHVIDYNTHCQLEFGEYVQTHESHDNTLAARTTGALALRPTGNIQGGFYFYSLNTGRILNRNRWTPLPMPADVIDHIARLARTERATEPIFTDGHGNPIPDDDPVLDSGHGTDPFDQLNDSAHWPIAGVEDPDADLDIDDDPDTVLDSAPNDDDNDPTEPDHLLGTDPYDDNMPPADLDTIPNIDPDDDNDILDVGINPAPTPDVIEINDDDEEGLETQIRLQQEMDAQYGPRSGRYNLRPRKAPRYDHLHTVLHEIVLTQHNLKTGLQLFGDDGIAAVVKELRQLHDRGVIKPIDYATLTPQQRRQALKYLMFLKQKRNGIIKGRGCADGRPQRIYTNKEDASSPTVATEALLLSCVIDACERRDVATIDIPNAFMQAPMEDVVYMVLEGTMVDLLLEIDYNTYSQFVVVLNGKKYIYVQLVKALYSTLKAALYFWKRLMNQMESWGFVQNPYDPCVVNKVINGS